MLAHYTFIENGERRNTNTWFTCQNEFVLDYLLGLVRTLSEELPRGCPEASKHTLVIRQRVCKYMMNALVFSVNYKDTGNTNVCHMTNFPMYPLLNDLGVEVYSIYKALFKNSLQFNNGYTKHCFERMVMDPGVIRSPYLSKRDFIFGVFYMVLTGRMKLSEELCKSYRYSSMVHPINQIFDLMLVLVSGPSVTPMESQSSVELTQHDFGVAVCHHGAISDARLWNTSKLVSIAAGSHKIDPASIMYRPTARGTTSILMASKGAFVLYPREEEKALGLLIINANRARSVAVFCTTKANVRVFPSALHFLQELSQRYPDSHVLRVKEVG